MLCTQIHCSGLLCVIAHAQHPTQPRTLFIILFIILYENTNCARKYWYFGSCSWAHQAIWNSFVKRGGVFKYSCKIWRVFNYQYKVDRRLKCTFQYQTSRSLLEMRKKMSIPTCRQTKLLWCPTIWRAHPIWKLFIIFHEDLPITHYSDPYSKMDCTIVM